MEEGSSQKRVQNQHRGLHDTVQRVFQFRL